MAERASQPKTVSGQPPTTQDQFWLDLIKGESPEKSLERLDSYGKYLLGAVSGVGTALTGFGIFGSGGSAALHHRAILLPLVLGCLSLAAAVMGITPQVHRVKLQDVISIRNYYVGMILWRGRCITAAGWLFAASLASAGAVLVLGHSPRLEPSVSMRLVGAGDAATMSASVGFANLPEATVAKTEVLGYLPGRALPDALFTDISHGDSAGNLSVSVDGLSGLKAYERLSLATRVTSAGVVLYEGTRTIERH